MNPVFDKSAYNWKHPIRNIRIFIRQIKSAVQRVRKGYSTYDLGDIDMWFLSVIPEMLYDLSNRVGKGAGYPAFFQHEYYNDHQSEINCTFDEFISSYPQEREWDEDVKKCEIACIAKWQGILCEIADLFKKLNDDDLSDEERASIKRRAFTMFEEWFDYLWF